MTTAAAVLATDPLNFEMNFEELVREHQRMVFSIGYHFLHNAAAAEEVAQDVFLELFKRLGTLESCEHVMYWLRRVACHRCIDYARRNKSAAAEVSWDQLPEPSQPVGDDPTNRDPMMSKRLQQMVAALPQKMRMVVILRYQEEAALEEIASTMGIPLNTVKSTLHRAHAMLRAKMEQTMAGERGEANA